MVICKQRKLKNTRVTHKQKPRHVCVCKFVCANVCVDGCVCLCVCMFVCERETHIYLQKMTLVSNDILVNDSGLRKSHAVREPVFPGLGCSLRGLGSRV